MGSKKRRRNHSTRKPSPHKPSPHAKGHREGPQIADPGPADGGLPTILMCCAQNGDAFLNNVIRGLAPYWKAEKLIVEDLAACHAALTRHKNIWIEWGNELAEYLTRNLSADLRGRRVILRIHAYEVMTGLAERIDYRHISDLIFVCQGMRDLLLSRRPEIRQQVERIHVIPNGVDTDKFQLIQRTNGHNLAYVGYINFKKSPVLLLHAFEAIHRKDPRFHLHLAGEFQDLYHQIYWQNFAQRNALGGHLHFHGWVKDLGPWLADKHFIMCTSMSESQGLGLMEAMATGCQPLIYNFHTAPGIYPKQYLWNNQDELQQALYLRQEPAQVRQFVVDNYSLALQVQRLLQMLDERQEVIFAGPVKNKSQIPTVPAACFAEDLCVRQRANKNFGHGLLQQGRLRGAAVFLERALAQSGYQDLEAAQPLTEAHIGQGRYDKLAQVHRDMGLAAAARGDYNTMLLRFYDVYYHAYRLTRTYRWQAFDQAIDTTLRLIAPQMEPLPAFPEVIARVDPSKIKLVIGTEGFNSEWSTIKRLMDLGLRMDKQRFEVIFFSRLAPTEEQLPLLDELARNGCLVACPTGDDVFAQMRQGLYLLQQIRADIFMLTTSWLTPHLDLLAHCRAARYQVNLATQGGGLETNADYLLTSVEGLLLDDNKEGKYIGPTYEFIAPHRRLPQARTSQEFKAAVIGRPAKLASESFWLTMAEVMRGLPELHIYVLGASAKDLFGCDESPFPRLHMLGFRRDVFELLPQFDLYIDTWPLGGGSTLREAHSAGLPAVSYRARWFEHYNAAAPVHVGLNEFVHPDLLLEECDSSLLMPVLTRLARDNAYYQRICHECAAIPVLAPDQFAGQVEEFLLQLAAR